MSDTRIEYDRSLNTLMDEKMTAIRIAASELFLSKKFNEEAYTEIVEKVKNTAASFPELNMTDVQEQLIMANKAFTTGSVKEQIKLNHPLYQFIWGATLMRIASQPDQIQKWPKENRGKDGLINSNIWEQIKNTDEMVGEMSACTTMLASRGTLHHSTLVRWGGTNYPNVGYYFSLRENLVNLDMLWALIGGLEHMTAAVVHEFAHASGSVQFTPVIVETRKQINELLEKKNKTDDDKIKLKALLVHDSTRYMIFDEAENSFANGYAKMLSQKGYYHQDLAYSLNAIETQLFGIGNAFLKNTIEQPNIPDITNNRKNDATTDDTNKKTPQAEFFNLKKVIRYGFYINNGLFENTADNWEKIGVHVDWIRGYDANGNILTGKDAIDELVRISAKLEALQIPVTTRRHGKYEKIQKACLKRGAIIDNLYKRFAYDIVIRMNEKEKEEMKKAAQNRQKQKNAPGQQQRQESGVQQEGNNNRSNQPDKKSNTSDDGRNNNQEENQNNNQTENEEDKNENNNQNENEENKNENKEQQNNTDGTDNTEALENGEKNNGADNAQNNQKNNNKNQNTDNNANKWQEPLSENPQDDRINRKKIADNDTGKTIDEIEKDAKERQENSHRNSPNNNQPNQEHSHIDLENFNQALSKSNFVPPEYKKEMHKYNEIISKHAALLKKLKDLFRQLRNIYTEDSFVYQHELLPQGVIEGALDINSVVNRIQKMQTGQQVDIDDYLHFRNPVNPKQKHAPIDVCVLIDVSGSVAWAGKSQFAVELGCLINEAVKGNNYFNLYLGLMVQTKEGILAEPGMDDKEIAAKLNTIYKGNKSWDDVGDKISFMTVEILKRIQSRKHTNEKEGYSHFFYITDGAHTDKADCVPLLNKLMDKSPITTFNWITFDNSCTSTALGQIKKDRNGKTGTKGVMVEGVDTIQDVMPAFRKILTTRIRDMKRKEAIETVAKAHILKDVLRDINR